MKRPFDNPARLLALVGAVCLALLFVLPAMTGCGGDESESSSSGSSKKKKKNKKKKGGKKGGKKPVKPKPKPKPDPKPDPKPKPDPDPKPAQDPPVAKARAMTWRFPKGQRIALQVKSRMEVKDGETVRDLEVVDGWAFLRCAGEEGGRLRVVRENPPPVEEIREGVKGEPRLEKDVEFLFLTPAGRVAQRSFGPALSVLRGLAEPVFPEGNPSLAWSVERDFREGRFLFSYTVAGEKYHDDRICRELRLAISLPGGDPCATLELIEGKASILFDPETGAVVRAEGRIAFNLKEEGKALAVTGTVEVTGQGGTQMGEEEGQEAQKAHETYFEVLRLIEKKSYAAAEKKINEFMEDSSVIEYVDRLDALRDRIPDTRTFRPEGLLERVRFDFGKLGWVAKQGPPIVARGYGKMKEGKPRVLDCVGKTAPEFWWKRLYRGGSWEKLKAEWKGKVLLLHVWMAWVTPSRTAVGKCHELAKEMEGVVVLNISMDTEAKTLNAFAKAQKLTHPTVWDRDNTAQKRFNLPGAPAYVIIDRSGTIRFGEVGWFKDKTLERIRAALAECLK